MYFNQPKEDYLKKLKKTIPSYERHNEEVQKVNQSFEERIPVRMPMTIGANIRILLLDKAYNPKGLTFAQYFNDPNLMFEWGAEFDLFKKLYIPCDAMMGVPGEDSGYSVNVDFQNVFDAAHFGCEILYPEDNVPVTEPILTDDNKEMLFHKGIPDPFGGIMAKNKEYYELFLEKAESFTLQGAKVKHVAPSGLGTDGPMTVACNLRGTTAFCIDLLEEPEYALQLLDYITESVITRIKAWKKYLGLPEKNPNVAFADDSIALLSLAQYRELILPFHQRIIAELGLGAEPNVIHLCGDASRFFKTIADELKVGHFDTGFPIKHGDIAQTLGGEPIILGGPHIAFLASAAPEEVKIRTKEIIEEVKPFTKRFIMREANNLAPGTPLENILAMYEAVKEYGQY